MSTTAIWTAAAPAVYNAHVKPEWQKVQDEFYSDPERHSHLRYDPSSVYASNLVGRMAGAVGLTPEQEVLEIGAGSGRFTMHLARRCRSLIAVDASQPLLDEIAAREVPSIHPLCADAHKLAEDGLLNGADLVCGFFVLHHLLEHERLFRSIFEGLKPGGRIGFLEPNRLCPFFPVQVMVSKEMTWEAERGMFTFSARETRRLWSEIGFREIELERFGFFPPAILDRAPAALPLERALERLPVVRRFLPFLLLTAQKPKD